MTNIHLFFARNRWISDNLIRTFNHFQLHLLSFYKGRNITKLISSLNKTKGYSLYANEAYMIYSIVRAQKNIKGDIAEVGVYNGASAKVICAAKGNKYLHLFDSFAGLPDVSKIDTGFKKSEYTGSMQYVKNLLSKYNNWSVYPGFFPKTAAPVKGKKFSFVNLDVDLYQSTIDSLKFFYPRLVPGGVIVSHDYAQAAGVRKAFDEFFKNKKEQPIELPERQCMIYKLG